MKPKLEEFIATLETLISGLKKTRNSGINPEKIEALKKIIPVLKETAVKFPKANDNQVGTWAVYVITLAPWIMLAPKNNEIASFLRGLNVTELHLSDYIHHEFFEKHDKRTLTHTKYTPGNR